MSTYQYSTFNFSHEAAIQRNTSKSCDFVSFLGIAQNLSIDFLPITWQQTLAHIGKGATAEIREAFLDKNTNLAFKRRIFRQSFNLEELESDILPSVVAEISILLNPSIRHCPNIMNIVGICWEIHCEENFVFSRDKLIDSSRAGIVPVLVFEKSKHGDLHDVMTSQTGNTLGFDERLQICIEIVAAIALMHSIDVIHGDIKPQNVLVFQTSTEVYTAKVADFGYSTSKATEYDLISMPRSLHWTGPEWHHRGFTREQAKNLDIYSLGLIIFWILCCNHSHSSEHTSHVLIPETPELARRFVIQSLEAVQLGHRVDLIELFSDCFKLDPTERLSDIDHFREILIEANPTGRPVPLDGEYPEGITKEYLMEQDTVACTRQDVRDVFTHRRNIYSSHQPYSVGDSFQVQYTLIVSCLACLISLQLMNSMYQLYVGDYRVRICIANYIIAAVSARSPNRNRQEVSSNICVQAALCYEIGFGVARDHMKSSEVIRGRIFWESEHARQLRHIRRQGVRRHFSSGIFNFGYGEGSVQLINSIESCGGQLGWERFQNEIKAEIDDAIHVFGPEHDILLILKQDLSNGFYAVGQWHRAERLQIEVLESTIKSLGTGHISTFARMVTLADIYRQQLRFDEARNLHMRVYEEYSRLGVGHPSRYVNEESLALTLAKQDRCEVSEELLNGVIHHHALLHGENHPKTLRSKMFLAQIYLDQGRHNAAENLSTQTLQVMERTQGPQHPDSLDCVILIAKARQGQGQFERAEKLFVSVVKKLEMIYGSKQPRTVDVMIYIAHIYSLQNKVSEAVKLQEEVVSLTKYHHGHTSPKACSEMERIVEMYKAGGQLDDAERMQEERQAAMERKEETIFVENILDTCYLSDRG